MIETENELLRKMIHRIVRTASPDRVILFGSHARENAHPDSDFDLLVIMDSDQPRYRRSAPMYTALADLPAEVDVVVYTPAEIQQWSGVPQALVTTAIREGKVLYERAN